MENDSGSQTSPGWPTHWPPNSFPFGWTLGFIFLFIGVFVITLVVAAFGAGIWLELHGQRSGLIASAMSHGTVVNAPVFIALSTAQLVAEACAVIAIIVALPQLTHLSLRDLGFRSISMHVVGYALFGAVGMVLVADVGSSVISSWHPHAVHPQAVEKLFETIRHEPSGLIFFILFAVVLQPIAEEMIFRVFIFNLVLRYGGFWVAAVVSAGLFGAAHTISGGADDVSAALLALGGIVLCWVYYRSRNAYASMISHGLFNALTVAALYFVPKLAGS